MQRSSGPDQPMALARLEWAQPIRFGRLRERLNRFVLAVEVPEITPAFLPNTGRLQELLIPGAEVGLLPADRQGATSWDAVMVRYGDVWVAIDNRVTERLIGISLQAGSLPGWGDAGTWRPEVRLGSHRLDFAAAGPRGRAWLEVKASNLIIDGVARFPGAPSVRATQHARLLAERARAGERAGIVFVVARPDARAFAPHETMDPAFAAALADAQTAGVRVDAYPCRLDEVGIRLLNDPLPVWL